MRLLEAIQESLEPVRLTTAADEVEKVPPLVIGGLHRGLSSEQIHMLSEPVESSEIIIGELPSYFSKSDFRKLASLDMSAVTTIRILGGGKLLKEEQIDDLISNPTLKGLEHFEVRNHPSMSNKLLRKLKRRARGKLRSLVVVGSGINGRGIDTAFYGESWAKLEVLTFHQGGLIDDSFINALASGKFPSLRVLDLGDCAITKGSVGILAHKGNFPALREVVIHRVIGGHDHASDLNVSRALRQHGLLRIQYKR